MNSPGTLLIPARRLTTATWRGVRRSIDAGEHHRVHRGWYAKRPEFVALKPEARHRARVEAVWRSMQTDGAAFSHTSAGTLWRLTLFRLDEHAVHTTELHGRQAHSTPDVKRHRDVLADEDLTTIERMPCTTLARTVIDIARTTSIESAICAADSAFRLVAWDDTNRVYDVEAAEALRDGIRTRLGKMTGKRGVKQARWVADFADGRAQLPGESLSRLRLWELGFTTVRLQVPVAGPHGEDFFVDFGLDESDAWGEFDGQDKYLDPAMTGGRTPREILEAEKLREDWIRATTGRPIARWRFDSTRSPAALADVLTRYGVRVPR